MTWLAEEPWYVLLIGVAAVAVTAIGYVQSRERGWGVALVVSLVLAVGLVAFERAMVTEREEVEAIVFRLRDALEANDLPAVQAMIAPQAVKMQDDAAMAMQNWKFTSANIVDLKLFFNRVPVPPECRVEFVGTIHGEPRSKQFESFHGLYRRRFILFFRRDDAKNTWLCYDYDHRDPIDGSASELPRP